jgi:molecular chaperone HscA
MTLLQISEPGKSTLPHERRRSIGIDLGTTNSLVASVINGTASIIEQKNGSHLLPSVVHYGANKLIIGAQAKEIQITDPENTVSSVKRLMGRSLIDLDTKQLPLKLKDCGEYIGIHTQQGLKNPVEVSSEILSQLKSIAEARLGDEIMGAVITVPAYFDDAQRQATKDAAKLAGINVLRLINEPTAAAVAYGLDQNPEGNYVIFDLGGGTFDISILRLSEGLFEVLATHGDAHLGGDDFDQAIVKWLCKNHNINATDLVVKQTLISLAQKIKETLTTETEIHINETINSSIHIKTYLNQSLFESITKDLIQTTLISTQQALRDTNLSISDIHGVIMVGGSTRMPCIQKAVEAFFKQPLFNKLNPDEVVALGAAQQAHILSGNSSNDLLLLDVIPLSLGIETMGDIIERIIPRNSTIPIAKAQEFTTYKDGQSAMIIHVVQGERELVKDCRSLAKFTLKGIPPMVAGAAKIRVTFQVDADGLLSVSAKELSTGIASSIEVKPSYGLSDETIKTMLEASINLAEEDKESRALAEVKIEAQQLCELVDEALKRDHHLLDKKERLIIQKDLKDLKKATQTLDRFLIQQLNEKLNQDSQSFAVKRMDQSIQKALTGKTINSLKL